MPEQLIWLGTFADRLADKAHAVAVFNRPIAEGKTVVPTEKLLVFEVNQGWQPL